MSLDLLIRGATRLGIALDSSQIACFERLADLLLEWNQRLNLTRIVDRPGIETRHFLDSLTCAIPVLDRLRSGEELRCIDVGSGAGFPGLPLAICFASLRVDMLEATGKKARFIERAIEALGLANASVIEGRAETIARDPSRRDRYDLVVARALAPLPIALEWCLPFARPGGVTVLPRGSEPVAQLREGRCAASQLSSTLREPVPISLPELPPGRMLIVADKLAPTDDRFPRRPGVATRRPLGCSKSPLA